MGRVSIEDIEPGMVLASDLTRSDGRFLLGKGVVLAPGHLRVLKIWGIHSVEVEGASDEMKPLLECEIDPAILRAAEELTRRRFSETNLDHPFLQELFHICTLHRARRMSETPGMEKTRTPPDSVLPREPKEAPASSMGKINPQVLVEEGPDLASLPFPGPSPGSATGSRPGSRGGCGGPSAPRRPSAPPTRGYSEGFAPGARAAPRGLPASP